MSTVLVVEDTLSELKLIKNYLQDSGYQVIVATDAMAALEQAVQQQPDVVITDVLMPGMSGFELCRKLKNHPQTKQLPIIICSSKDQAIDRIWGMKQGAAVYVTKPFTREQLVSAVKSVVA